MDVRTYTYTYKGNCVPFGSGKHDSPEEALKEALKSTIIPEDKVIIIQEFR